MMKTRRLTSKQVLPLVATALLWPLVCRGNNLTITNVSLVNPAAGEADVQFTLRWDNSWRESWTENGGTTSLTNWDAVWVFAKYRQTGGLWKHLMLTPTGHLATGGTVIEVPDDGGGKRLGAFVHRTASGTGTVTCTNMRLHWNLAAAGLPSAAEIDLKVMGVEMVYIPQGSFYLGSGGTEINHFHAAADPSAPFLVTGEAAIPLGSAPGQLNATNGLAAPDLVPAAFPKGFKAFYCMKYEVSEGQYVDFLNLLDPSITGPYFSAGHTGSNRYTIEAVPGGSFATAAPDRACTYMNDTRLLTYFDWSGLRPLTELEFEKACRGVRQPWINEYAWGNATYTALTGFAGTDGSGTETALPVGANVHVSASPFGPVRSGLFATGSTSREGAGAGYYGVMELSGNLEEMVVDISQPVPYGRAFTDVYGDGNEYTSYGNQWPSPTLAYGGRGGQFSVPEWTRTSDRSRVSANVYLGAAPSNGGRGARTAP